MRYLSILLLAFVLASCGGEKPPSSDKVLSSTMNRARSLEQAPTQDYTEVLQLVYLAYFGRPADPAGLQFWSEQLAKSSASAEKTVFLDSYSNNVTVRNVIDSFSSSQESQELYRGDDSLFIDSVYKNLFNRSPDRAGKEFWTKAIANGTLSRGTAALTILLGARDEDERSIYNKKIIALGFTQAVQNPGYSAAYADPSSTNAVRELFQEVNFNTDLKQFSGRLNATMSKLAATSFPNSYKITGTAYRSYLVTPTGDLWVLHLGGDQSAGPKGDGTEDLLSEKHVKKIGTGFAQVSGVRHGPVYALKTDGSLWVWGTANAPIGDGLASHRKDIFTQTQIGSGFSSLGGGRYAFKPDGSLWAWGMTGLTDSLNHDNFLVPTKIRSDIITVKSTYGGAGYITRDGKLSIVVYEEWLVNGEQRNKKVIHAGGDYVDFSFGDGFIVAMKRDGTVWAWGRNFTDNYGFEDFESKKLIFTGMRKLIDAQGRIGAISADGKVWILKDKPVQIAENAVDAFLNFGGDNFIQKAGGEYVSLYTDSGSIEEKPYVFPSIPYIAPPTQQASELVYVDKVSYGSLYWDKLTEITVTGRNLPSDLKLTVGPCTGNPVSRGMTEQKFTCTIRPYQSSGLGGVIIPASYLDKRMASSVSSSRGELWFGETWISRDPNGGVTGPDPGSDPSAYQCPTKKKPFDPVWIQSHSSYWAAASAHDAYVSCQNSGQGAVCKQYLDNETKLCAHGRAVCLALVVNASDCPG